MCLIDSPIDLLAILQKSLDRALFLYSFIRDVRSSGVRASITIVHIRKFYQMQQSIVRLRFFLRIAKRSIPNTAGLAGLAGLLNLLLQKAEGLADFGEILDFICRTLKTRQLCSRCHGKP